MVFSRPDRLCDRTDFLRVQLHGERFRGEKITLLIAASSAAQSARLGLTISRKVGGAVVRNRVRRQLREASRSIGDDLIPGFDYVVIAAPQAARCTYAILADELTSLVKRSRAWASRKKSS